MSDPSRPTPPVRIRSAHTGPGLPGKIESAKNPNAALRHLVSFLKPMLVSLVVAGFFIFASTVLGLAGPWLMGLALDRFIAARNTSGLAGIAVLMLAVFFAGNVFDFLSGWIMAGVSQKALGSIRQKLFDRLQSLPVGFFDRTPSGELMSRLTNDIEAVNQAVSQNVMTLFASVLGMAGILAAMIILNVWLALASLVVMPLMFAFAKFVAAYTRKGFRELQKRLGQLNGILEESISGQRVAIAFGRGGSAVEEFRKKNREVHDAAVYANTYALLLMPLTNQLGNLFVIVISGIGGMLALKGTVTAGLILTFISYGRNFINPLRQIANVYNALQAALAGAERVFEIIDAPAEPADSTSAVRLVSVQGGISFDRVNFSYEPGIRVIRNMSFTAKPGETIALVGKTGAGKTTIVNLLTRFYEMDNGGITLDGVDIRAIKRDDLRRATGIVLQDTFLFQASVLDNIRYGKPGATDEEVVSAAMTADADQFIRQLPDGYRTMLSERAGTLSQGQRQLLAISRAVLAKANILILDEATSSIDTRTEARIQSSLLKLMKGKTSFVIAHRLGTIREADRILVIEDGEIAEQGSYQELIGKKGIFFRLYQSQFKGEEI